MNHYNSKCIKVTLLGAWLFVSYTIYYKMVTYPGILTAEIILNQNLSYFNTDSNNYLIHTPGCSIPDYTKTYKVKEAKDLKKSCGLRAVYAKKKNDNIISFTINENIMKRYSRQKYSCCYQFVSPSRAKSKVDVRKLSYSSCTSFKNGTETQLKEEVLLVTCKLTGSSKPNNKYQTIYKDVYGFVKKINRTNVSNKDNDKWNILILGMDTMSRARFYTSMPKTANHLKKYKWLDFSGYQKVGYNTFPNVMAMLTGKKMSTIYKTCSAGMDQCNDKIIWSEFKKAGYTTATGEDNLNLPDTFSKYGYVSPPTDHYLRPLFLTGEEVVGNHVCTKKKSSVKHVLDYALDFVKSYKNQKSFGMFWMNSYSHNLEHIPSLIDGDIVIFFQKLYRAGVLKNTFLLFLSDHGIRYGKSRIPYESYYEERLPMLFVRVPEDFRKKNSEEYENMKINQKRLITAYDLYLTFCNVLEKTNITAEACSSCLSIFNEISPYRTCADAGVHDKWCTCHNLKSIKKTDPEVAHSIKLAEIHLHNTIKEIKTLKCKKCEILKISTVLRSNTYEDETKNNTFYVLAFVTTPGEVAYEAVVLKHKDNFKLFPLETISTYNTRGSCVKNPNDRAFCVCKSSC